MQSEEFLDRLLVPSLKNSLPLMKNVLTPLSVSVLISLGLTAAGSVAAPGTHKKYFDRESVLST